MFYIDIGRVKVWRSNFITPFYFHSCLWCWQLTKEVKYFYLAFASLVSLRTPNSFLQPAISRHSKREMSCLSLKIKISVNYKFTAERNCWSKQFCLRSRVTYTAVTASCVCVATRLISRSAKLSVHVTVNEQVTFKQSIAPANLAPILILTWRWK